MSEARDRYIETATRLFAEKGVEGASLAAIAAECGVSKQALLHFFGSKAQIYREVLERLADRLSQSLQAAHSDDPAETLIAYFKENGRAAAEAPDDARLVARALLDGDPAAKSWPLKPYLDALTGLARATPPWRDRSPGRRRRRGAGARDRRRRPSTATGRPAAQEAPEAPALRE